LSPRVRGDYRGGVVCGDGVEGMAEQVLEGGVGGEVALEVSVRDNRTPTPALPARGEGVGLSPRVRGDYRGGRDNRTPTPTLPARGEGVGLSPRVRGDYRGAATFHTRVPLRTQKKSATKSPSLEEALIIRSNNASGFWVGKSNFS
jgi:hypothetical protein